MPAYPTSRRVLRRIAAVLVIAGALLLGAVLVRWNEGVPMNAARPERTGADRESSGPPWRYGRADARFTLVEYADLECPYCQAYFPVLKRWINRHPEVNWQWHHLPLPMHEPAATRESRLAECAGQTQGHAAFWDAVAWIYQHTRGEGRGLPDGAEYPGMTATLRACLDSAAPPAAIEAQVREAAREHIASTPTLRLRDRQTGKTLMLYGPVEGDALLSAIDFLTTPEHDIAR
jgi:protein-disulfide isomerase